MASNTPISQEEWEQFIKQAVEELGAGSDVQLFQMGELEENVRKSAYN